MNYPCIIVERPHQTPGRTWVAESDEDLIDQLANCRYGDNWGWQEIASRLDLEDKCGEIDDWPEELRESAEGKSYPAILVTGPAGAYLEPVGETSELDWAIEHIGYDFHALNILESREEAESLLEHGGHNVPYDSIRESMQSIFWVDDEEADD